MRLRTSDTNQNGLGVAVTGGEAVVGTPVHLVFTWSSASERALLYLNGAVVTDVELGGRLDENGDGWDPDFRLGLGDEFNANRAWRGTYHLVVFYRRALTAEEVRANFASPDRPPNGPPTTSPGTA